MSKQSTAAASPPKKKNWFLRALDQWQLQTLALPGIILLIVFSYLPMYGLIMAFQEFRIGDFPGMSEWVGLKQFQSLFGDPTFGRTLRNTLAISFLKLTIGFVAPIIFAVFLNEMHHQGIKKTIQTVSYLPHFISWTVCALLMFDFLGVEGGAVNEILMALHLVKEPIPFFQDGRYFWGIALLTDMWKEVGWGSIIYISAMAGVDAEMYEYADVIDTYVYRYGLSMGRVSFATAAGLFKSVINFALLLAANWIAGKVGDNAMF